MITLRILLVLIGAFSAYRLYRECKLKNIKFNPLDADAFACIFTLVGALIFLEHCLYLIITYLP